MSRNIFEKIETDKEPPEGTKEEVISNIESIEKGKDPSRMFNTKLFGSLVNFFKLNNTS